MNDSKMITSKTVFKSDNAYTNKLLEGNVTHTFKRDEKKIKLEDGTEFEKSLQSVFPIEFTQWISGVQLVKNAKDKRPVKGKKRWTKLPEMIDTVNKNCLFVVIIRDLFIYFSIGFIKKSMRI